MNRWIDSPGCPDSVELDRFVNSELSRTDDELIESHVEKCQECQGYLASKSHQDPDLVDWVGTQQSSSGNALYRKPLIEGYEIIELHKTGGQGILYKARDIHLERVVAIKLLRNYGINKFKDEIPLIKEARTIARLSHPNIVKLHGMTRTDRGPCMIMDWVEGGSLLDYLQSHDCTQEVTVRLLITICDVLEYAHSSGILHMDIKASNILLSHGNISIPLLCDFGLAKSRRDGGDFSTANVVIGTAGFMAPEMISGRFGRISQASDIYSVGALLYQLLTGKPPHQSETVFETLERTCDYDVIAPSYFNTHIARDLETICLKCLRRDPFERYGSIKDLKDDLEQFQQNLPVKARRNTFPKRIRIWSKEHPWIAGLAATLLCVLCGSVILLSYLLNRAIKSENNAEQELARTVETFKLSAPLLKRFVSISVLKKDEIKKIENIANLLKDLGTSSKNLRQRFDLIYVGLELASELKHISDQQSLSERMTRESRISLKQLIDENSDELDRMAFLMDEGKIAISLLDQALIRYGHSCIQLYEILQIKQYSNFATESESLLDEAISTAERVTIKNPEVDEAFTDLANYYIYKIAVWKSENSLSKSAEVFHKLVGITEKMARSYPNDPDKFNYWINSINHRIMMYIENGEDDSHILEDFSLVEREMKRFYQKDDKLWAATALTFFDTLMLQVNHDFSLGHISKSEDTVERLFKLCMELVEKGISSKLFRNRIHQISLERIALYHSQPDKKIEATRLFDEMVHFWKSTTDDGQNPLRLSILYMLCPIPEKRSSSKALEILRTLDSNDPIVKYFTDICNKMTNSVPLTLGYQKQDQINPVTFDILKAESYLNASEFSEAAHISNTIAENKPLYRLLSISNSLWLKEIDSRTKSLNTTNRTNM